ncbi:MAG: hypothetical protein IT184_02570 [Acidobacteria bacterium]|nr:hypothetical protein [Acidobacteriota bacterium]
MAARGAGSIWRVGGLVSLALGLVTHAATAQDRTGTPSGALDRRLSLEAAAGPQISYVGSTVSAALGFAPTRRLSLLVTVERSHVRDEIEQLEDGYAFERGGTETFVSAELRYAFLAERRVSPYVVGGAGRGVSRPTVNEFFPDANERNIQVIYYGAGVRVPLAPRIDAFVDARFIMALEAVSDYFGVRFPVRGGIAWRF